ncbi:MAG TPA: hypothetical protein VFG68_14265 [Fimbriiglobus sp.]|nr:hypothetical protein [Fimbriiglobus sp.]
MGRCVGVVLWLGIAGPAFGQQITYSVTFDDPNQTFANYYQPLTQNLQAAGGLWNNYLRPASAINLEVVVKFNTGIARATGRSLDVVLSRRTAEGFNLYEQGAGSEVRTGIDPNPARADIELALNPDYLRNELWLDPDPARRTATVPTNRTDAMSVMMHELGHAFAYNGWRKGKTDQTGTIGDLPGNYLSTFDQYVRRDGDVLVYDGPLATSRYGGKPVPITLGSYAHLGNKFADPGETQLPGTDLIPDLMNGVAFYRGTRYDLSILDVAIVADSEVPTVPVPEPILGLGVGVVGLAGLTLRRARRAGVG